MVGSAHRDGVEDAERNRARRDEARADAAARAEDAAEAQRLLRQSSA